MAGREGCRSRLTEPGARAIVRAMPTANTALAERIFGKPGAGFAPLDGPTLLESMTDDVRYTVIGSTAASGLIQGRDQILARIVAPLVEALDGGLDVAADAVFGEGDYVAVQARGRAQTKRGARYDNTYCFVLRFRDGRIAEVTEYLDTELVRKVLG